MLGVKLDGRSEEHKEFLVIRNLYLLRSCMENKLKKKKTKHEIILNTKYDETGSVKNF